MPLGLHSLLRSVCLDTDLDLLFPQACLCKYLVWIRYLTTYQCHLSIYLCAKILNRSLLYNVLSVGISVFSHYMYVRLSYSERATVALVLEFWFYVLTCLHFHIDLMFRTESAEEITNVCQSSRIHRQKVPNSLLFEWNAIPYFYEITGEISSTVTYSQQVEGYWISGLLWISDIL